MRARFGLRDAQRGTIVRCLKQLAHKVGRKKWRVGCHRHHMTDAGAVGFHPFKPRVHTGERTGIANNAVRDDWDAKGSEARGIPVRIDDDIGDLGLQPVDNAGEDRSPAEHPQALIAAAHAT